MTLGDMRNSNAYILRKQDDCAPHGCRAFRGSLEALREGLLRLLVGLRFEVHRYGSLGEAAPSLSDRHEKVRPRIWHIAYNCLRTLATLVQLVGEEHMLRTESKYDRKVSVRKN